MDLVNGVYEYEVELEDGHESIINVFLSNIRRPLLEDESVLYDEDGMVVVMNDSLVKYVCDQESRYIIRYDGSKFIRNKAIWISTAEIKYEGEILKIFYRGEIDINSSKMPEKGGVVEYYYNGRRISVDVLVEYEREEMAGVVREVENTGDYPNRSNHKLSMKLKKSTTNNKHYDKLIPVFYNSITNGRKSTICYSLLQHNKIANYFTFFINCGRVRVFITSRFINTVEMNNLIQSDKLDPEAIMAIPKESSRIQFNRNPINITNKFDQYMNLVVAPDQLIGGYSSDLLLNKDVEISHPNPFIILIKLLYSLKPADFCGLILVPVAPDLEYLLSGPFMRISSAPPSTTPFQPVSHLNLAPLIESAQLSKLNQIQSNSPFPLEFTHKSAVIKEHLNDQPPEPPLQFDISTGESVRYSLNHPDPIISLIRHYSGELDYRHLLRMRHLLPELARRICMDQDSSNLPELISAISDITNNETKAACCTKIGNFSWKYPRTIRVVDFYYEIDYSNSTLRLFTL